MPSSPEEIEPLTRAATEAGVPIDISSQPGLWGSRIPKGDRFLTYASGTDYERATDQTHAANLIQADIIQTLSAIGHETIDVYFLKVRRSLQEFQVNGVLEAMEQAKQEGHIGYLGLFCDGDPFAALALWQFHDAFELLLTPWSPEDSAAYDTLTPLARERRVGIIAAVEESQPLLNQHPLLISVRSADEVRAALPSEAYR